MVSRGDPSSIDQTELLLDDGIVLVSKTEVASLCAEGPSEPSASPGTANEPPDPDRVDRIIIENLCEDYAMQINAPIAGDVWENMSVQIKNNVARGYGLQVNYQMHREDARELRE